MSLNVAKLKLIQDVEDRLKDELMTLESIKSQMMQLLHTNSLNTREVRYSELIYDESSELLVKTIDSLKNNPIVQDYQNQVRRIYKFRVEAATRDTLFEVTESPWIVHAEVVGNILENASYNKDLLRPFFNKALPKHLRRNVWRSLLTYPEAEQEYINLFKEARWKTLSVNEVEITKRSVELLSEHCHSLAFNEKIVTAIKVVLSYIEKIMQRRLPEYMYYIFLPIMYTLTDLTASLPRLVGICLKITEIQTTVWSSNKEQPIIDVFFECLQVINSKVLNKIKALIDLQFQENKVKLENFIRPFLSRLGSGFFSIETTCVVFDQLIMINTLNKMYFIFALSLHFFSAKLLACEHWDDFLAVFFKEVRKITPMDLEFLLEKLPDSEDFEARIRIPVDLKGQDYLDYVLQAQEFELEERHNKVNELGELLSAKRLLAEDPLLGMHQQKMMKFNLMEQALNKTKDVGVRRNDKKGTLINANLTRISVGSKHSGNFIFGMNNSKDSREIINMSGNSEMFIEENSFRKGTIKENEIRNSIFQDTSLGNLRASPKKTGTINDISLIKDVSLGNNSENRNKKITTKDNSLFRPVPVISETPENSLNLKKRASIFGVDFDPNRSSRLESDEANKSPEILDSQHKDLSEIEDNSDELPDLSYLGGGLLGIPDLSGMKPGLLDGFDD